MKKFVVAGLAALGLATTPVMAEAIAPATQPVSGESALGEDGSPVALALLAGIVAIIVLAIIDDDGDDDPVSA